MTVKLVVVQLLRIASRSEKRRSSSAKQWQGRVHRSKKNAWSCLNAQLTKHVALLSLGCLGTYGSNACYIGNDDCKVSLSILENLVPMVILVDARNMNSPSTSTHRDRHPQTVTQPPHSLVPGDDHHDCTKSAVKRSLKTTRRNSGPGSVSWALMTRPPR